MIKALSAASAFVGRVLFGEGEQRISKWELAYRLEARRADRLQSMLLDEQERAQQDREMLYRYMGVKEEDKLSDEVVKPRKPIYTYKSRTQKIREAELASRVDVAAPEPVDEDNGTTH